MAGNNRRQILLSVIDAQHDFVHEDGSLYIGNSPDEMAKIADAIMRLQADDAKHASEQAPKMVVLSYSDSVVTPHSDRLLRMLREEPSIMMVGAASPTIQSTICDLLQQIQDDLNGKNGGTMTQLAVNQNITGFGPRRSCPTGLAEQADIVVSVEAMSHCVRSEPARRHRKIPHPPTKLKVGKQGRR